MPKYVAKEDVEKGLVDPTRSLDEQPEYKKKIQEVTKHKEIAHEPKKNYQRPKKERPPRKERPKFNWNKQDITLDTQPPEKPKKLLEKPDAKRHKEGLEKLKSERETIKLEKSKLFDEQRALIREFTQSKKNGRAAITQYSGVMKEKMGLENQLRKQIKTLDDYKKKINAQIEVLQRKNDVLKRPDSSYGYSIESLKSRIQQKEHVLTTANIDKKAEAKLNNQITELKRALPTARPMIEIQSEINKLEDSINILFKELKPIKHELHIKITEANGYKAELQTLKEQKKSEQGNIEEKRTVEDIKAEYDIKIKAIEAKRDKLEQRIDDYMFKFDRERDDYEDQQDLLDYIDWVEKQIEYLKKKKEEDDKRKKEKEKRDKKKQKQQEDYEKRKEQRKKKDEERKARDEERVKKLEEEKERFINKNPNHQIIDMCQTLIDYCETLKPSFLKKQEDSRSKNPGELNFGKEWHKEIKGGAQVVVSKKAKQDEQVKKVVKQKKKDEKGEDQDFDHGIEVVNQFQGIKLLPPRNASEIDSIIKLIQEKIALYSNPTEEEKTAFKEKAIKEWDQIRAARDTRRQGNFKQRQEETEHHEKQPTEKKHHHKKEKKEFKEGDFPELA